MKKEETEYTYKKIIGRTCETFSTDYEKSILDYYHKQELSSIIELIKKMGLENFDQIVDLGCSVGVWYDDFKNLSFKRIIGVDISEERAALAKKRGFDDVHVCNAYDMPFETNSQHCIVSSDVFVHVLQDSDKLKIFNEVKRVLHKNGIFIFNFPNAIGFGYNDDTTREYERYNKIETISNLVKKSGLKIEFIIPSYYTVPRIAAHPKVAKFSSKFVFPLFDSILKAQKNFSKAKVIYCGVRRE